MLGILPSILMPKRSYGNLILKINSQLGIFGSYYIENQNNYSFLFKILKQFFDNYSLRVIRSKSGNLSHLGDITPCKSAIIVLGKWRRRGKREEGRQERRKLNMISFHPSQENGSSLLLYYLTKQYNSLLNGLSLRYFIPNQRRVSLVNRLHVYYISLYITAQYIFNLKYL